MLETTRKIICDRCGINGPEALEGESARRLAELDGWSCGDQDLCPACKDKPASEAHA